MIPLTRERLATVRRWLEPERPGPLVAQHLVNTGHGRCLADRWPHPRALLAEVSGNYVLDGDPAALKPADLRGRVTGVVAAPERFVPLLRDAFDDVREWSRVVLTLPGPPATPPGRAQGRDGYQVRRLGPADADGLDRLEPDLRWIGATWGGPAGLAASGTAWGVFAGPRLVAVACPFFVGSTYVDIGVVTQSEARGRGLSVACAAAVCHDIRARGATPTWSTSPDNLASLRVADKLGFTLHRHDRLHVIGVPIPGVAQRPAG